MVDTSIEDTSWMPWVVAPGSGFEVRDPRGAVGLIQINRSQFLVTQPFRFTDRDVEQRLIDELVSSGKDAPQAESRSTMPAPSPRRRTRATWHRSRVTCGGSRVRTVPTRWRRCSMTI